MKKHLLATALLASCFTANATIVEMQTDLGSITVHLYDQHTPITVENFLNYVADGSYDGTVIHRSVDNFVLQGGGYRFDSGSLVPIPTDPEINSEAGISNVRGTVALAKVGNRPSGDSQWFINLKDNTTLDHTSGGYTVFGKITEESMLDVIYVVNKAAKTLKPKKSVLPSFTFKR